MREWTVLTNVLSEEVIPAQDLTDALVQARQRWPRSQIVSVIEVEPVKRKPGRPPGSKNRWPRPQPEPRPAPPPRPAHGLSPGVEPQHQPRPSRARYTADNPRLCECGEPSINSDPRRAPTCVRCKELEGSFLSAAWGAMEPKRDEDAPVHISYSKQHVVPQLDSRTIHSGLAEVIKEMNRVKPWTTM